MDKTVRVWNADGSGVPVVLRGHTSGVVKVEWSPDGRRFVSAAEDKTVRVWNADGSAEPLSVRRHDANVSGAAWSPDGRRIVSASDDGNARIWNADGTGEPIVLPVSKEMMVWAVSWSPDGRRIAAASANGTIVVWSDLEPLTAASDPRLWTATTYCMPLAVRRRLLGFADEQAKADLERCERLVGEAQSAAPAR
jgi:WD40 repeat protein